MTDSKLWKTGASCTGIYPLEEQTFAAYATGGVTAMEISFSCLTDDDRYARADYESIKKWSKAYGVELWSLHAPFRRDFIDIAAIDRDLREFSVKRSRESVEYAAMLGINKVVIHPSSEPIEDKDRLEQLKWSRDSLVRLADSASKLGVTLCVENLPRTCLANTPEELNYLLEADGRLKACFDTNHLLMCTHEHFMSLMCDKIMTVHISDYDFIDERHWLAGEGKIDWTKLVALLEKADYSGAFMYEFTLKPKTSMPRSRDLSYADLRSNHMEIAKRLPITRVL